MDIIEAAIAGNRGYVKELLLRPNVYINTADNNVRTPLSWAAQYGHEAVVRLLLENEADPDLLDNAWRSPLSWASEYAQNTVVRAILELHTRKGRALGLDTPDEHGQTPLSYATGCSWYTYELEERRRRDKFFDPTAASRDLDNRYLPQSRETEREAIVRLLLPVQADPSSKDEDGRTPLHWAAHTGQTKIVGLFLEGSKSSDPKKDTATTQPSLDEQGHNAKASEFSFTSIDIDPNMKDTDGETALSLAVRNSREATVRQILQHSKIDPNIKNEFGETPIFHTIQDWYEIPKEKFAAIARELLQHRAIDLNTKDCSGETPLCRASVKGCELIVGELLRHPEVDPNMSDDHGRTPLLLALEKQRTATVETDGN